ncbi:MAG: flagellar associated protein [Monoraphidium minutum]|nr:MAG: flagellar associated protein [Monoraphidium minutum]
MSGYGSRQDAGSRMLYPQLLSTKPSSPGIGMGTSKRDGYLKQYLLREQSRATGGNNSPGPVYATYAPQGLGRQQQDSRRCSSPRAVFGTCSRDAAAKVFQDRALMRAFQGRDAPAPNTYTLPGAVGRQLVSTRPSSPSFGMGSGLRPQDMRQPSHGMPGPGRYQAAASALGRQLLSTRPSQPAPGFGSGTRDAITLKTYISRAHCKSLHSASSPGPATAVPYGGTAARQVLSTRSSAPGWGFGGGGARFQVPKSCSPGVGAYYA